MGRGQVRIYIAAASGAGATYAMLDEAFRRQSRGARVFVGCVRTYDRPATAAKLAELLGDARSAPEVLDLHNVLAERPDLVIVDELATPNPAGSRHAHRWQDVDALREAGIDVITTMTVQQVESLADPVERITGSVPEHLVPDEFLARADQFELIDIAPEAIRRRIAHGNVFPPDVDPAQSELFSSDAVARLRVLLLFWLADHLAGQVDRRPPEAREHVVVAVSGAPGSASVVRRAARLAQRSRAALVGVHVRSAGTDLEPGTLNAARALLNDLGGTFTEIEGDDVPVALVRFAESVGATQLVLGTSDAGRRILRRRSLVEGVVAQRPDVDVHVVSHADVSAGPPRRWRIAPPMVSPRRQIGALLGGVVVLTVLTVVLSSGREDVTVATALGLYLLAVVGVAAVGGWLPGLLAAVAAPVLVNWFLIEPYHTLRVSDPERIVELVVFVSVAVVVSTFVSISARRAVEADQARREATNLAVLAGSGGPDALQLITDHLCSTFALDGVAVLESDGGPTVVIASSGDSPPASTDAADFSEPIAPGVVVAASGRALTADEHRVLRVFLRQMSDAVDRHRVASRVAEAEAVARADELRTAILRSVSHDLRTPLAGIKASVSSLRQHDVVWPDDVRDEFLASIEDDTDRLTVIVSNLLDMSRLQAGTLEPQLRAVALEEVVPAAVHSLGPRADLVDIALPDGLPDVSTDPALLERVLANLVSNAVEFSPPTERVRVSAHADRSRVHVYVTDHGPGIRPQQRATVVQPFHRLSDAATHSGVGLGLAIADGLTTAMGGRLELRDTPRGGVTAVVTLPVDGEVPT